MAPDKLAFCRRRLMDLGYTEQEAALWLMSAHPQLEGQRAIDVEYHKVSAILGRLESGAYL